MTGHEPYPPGNRRGYPVGFLVGLCGLAVIGFGLYGLEVHPSRCPSDWPAYAILGGAACGLVTFILAVIDRTRGNWRWGLATVVLGGLQLTMLTIWYPLMGYTYIRCLISDIGGTSALSF